MEGFGPPGKDNDMENIVVIIKTDNTEVVLDGTQINNIKVIKSDKNT